MTVVNLARQLGVSTMTIYRRAKKRGIVLNELRDDLTGELTAEGVATLAALFDATGAEMTATRDATRPAQGCNTETQWGDVGGAAVLQARLDGAMALIEQRTSERDDLRRQVEALAAALAAALATEQADRQDERRLLTGRGRGWRWPWARR